MTKSSAELLYELFMRWWEAGPYPSSSRGSSRVAQVEESRLATRYLNELETLIEASGGLSDRHPLKGAIPKFWSWIFAHESWSNSLNSNYVTDTEIGLLHDFRYNPVNQVGQPVVSSLEVVREGIPGLIEEVDSDTSLNDDVKRYVKTVLHHAYKVLSVDSGASAFEQGQALSELAMALGLATSYTQDSEKASWWRQKANEAAGHFVSGFFGALGGSAATLALTVGNVPGQIMGS